jgi:hypothetical protein
LATNTWNRGMLGTLLCPPRYVESGEARTPR